MALVLAPIAKGTLQSIDYSKAKEIKGVMGFVDASDLPTRNKLGHVNDTPVFVDSEVG